VVEHSDCSDHVEGPLREIYSLEVTVHIGDVIVVGPSEFDARPVDVEADHRRDSRSEPSSCLTFPAAHIEAPACARWDRAHQVLERVKIRVPTAVAHSPKFPQAPLPGTPTQ
jgi:hypothetical protein